MEKKPKKPRTPKQLPDPGENKQQFDVWIDKQELMMEFHLGPRTVGNYRKKNLLPYSRIGKKIVYNRTEIEQRLKDQLRIKN